MNIYMFTLIYIFVINIIGFIVMAYDKKLAEQHAQRISEKALFTIAILLGGIGIYWGMYQFRHKTKHKKFTIGIPLCILLNIITLVLLILYVFPIFG